MASKPTIVIVPGAWQLTTGYAPFADLLRQSGFDTKCVTMPSTGGTQLPLTGLAEDIAAVRAVIQSLVDAGKEVVLLVHSAGGVSGSGGVRGLDVKTRKKAGLSGGVTRVIYMAAFMLPKGTCLLDMVGGEPLPWMVLQNADMGVKGDRVTIDPESMSDVGLGYLPPEEQKRWGKELSHTSAILFEGVSEYEPWNEGIPCAYIFAEDDGAIHYPVQQKMAAQLGPNALTATLKSSHCPFLSMQKELLEAVEKIVAA
ncbi:Pyrethroid hydrolase [Cytospora mali]|uniref:Pyrethroid hydrolase n=1 Tax=Cytospora mali TaxID=578113 RepID=A0A194V5F0_CYTMA|nr:Pyrethroid hydrolase [Valsa mali var. pyri (nom. inval.)]